MGAKPDEIFLIQGQIQQSDDNTLAPTVQQCVVVAPNHSAAYECLAQEKPRFRPLGLTTLEDHEKAASTLHSVVNRTSQAWELFVAKDMTPKSKA